MHRLDDESTCGLEIPIGPILVSTHQHGCERYDQPARGEVFYVGDDTFSRHAADLSADKLNCDHERCRQKNRPQQAIPKLRPGLGISRDADGSSSAAPVTSPGPSRRNKCGDLLSSVSEEFMAQTSNIALLITKMFILRNQSSFRSVGADPHVMQDDPLRAFPLLQNVQARGDAATLPQGNAPRP